MRRLSKEQILLLHTQLIEEFGGTGGVRDYNLLDSALETQKRMYLALEATSLGRGGIKEVSAISGVHRNTISAGIKELRGHSNGQSSDSETSIRSKGGGRKPITVTQSGIMEALDRLVDPESYGNPENPLRWTPKSLRNLEDELAAEGFAIKYRKIGYLLKELGFSLQQTQKMKQVGKRSPDRDKQFRHINETVKSYLSSGEPVNSVDCKKKENIGNFKNNEGYVNVGISSDTAMFAVNSIRNWWCHMGVQRFPNVSHLYITADGGGSNGSKCRLWKTELQKLADELLIPIEVSHFPPGTSKWNKIEHRMFSQISKNWRARPLESLEVIVNLIASTTTESGLQIKCGIDTNEYKTGIKVSDEELAGVNLVENELCGKWNYTIYPSL